VDPHPELLASLPPLLRAAAIGDRDGVDRLVGAEDVNAAAEDGWTALHAAARADPDARAAIGWRPIHRFAGYGNADGLRAILAATGQHVDVRDDDEDDSTALMDAAETGSLACVELLLEAGADPLLKCRGETVADLAAKHGHDEIVSRLRSTNPR
jgi:ankyrin repeat protein